MKIAIIGGGAAGMMAAAALLEEKTAAQIHLFEKNKILGQKVIISGGGRCNVTTGITDKNILRKKYTRGADFLIPAIAAFPPAKVREWFEARGVPLKNEPDNRVFPVSDDGHDVVGAFEKMFELGGVQIHLTESVKTLLPTPAGFTMETNKDQYEFDVVIITTGGNAYRHTWSTGDGYEFAKACGHTITKLGPSLNSFEVVEEWPKTLSGLSLPNAKLTAIAQDGEKKTAVGPMLFTHFGITGPAVFALSSHLAFTPISKTEPLSLTIIPDEGHPFEKLEALLQERYQTSGTKQLRKVINEIYPKRFVDVILEMAGAPKNQTMAKLSKELRRAVVHLLSGALQLNLSARRPGDEFVTAGGVDLKEVDAKTMRSKLNANLYFAGEVLDVDGVTGGFNLQSSWAAGRLAGKSIAKAAKK
jgi:predicted Rossmann fold flavoprotein